MKKGFVWMGAALAAVSVLGTSAVASASSHREAPAISKDPAVDNTDVYAWVDGTGGPAGTMHVVVAYNPFELPEGGPNYYGFSDDALYEIHLARGSKGLADAVTYQIKFTTPPIAPVGLKLGGGPAFRDGAVPDRSTPIGALSGKPDGLEFFSQIGVGRQTYTVTQIIGGVSTVLTTAPATVAPYNIGTRTNKVAYGFATGETYESKFGAGSPLVAALTGGGKSWAGPRDDGFYVDLGGFFDLANLRSTSATGGLDGVAGFNNHAIALDIPIASLGAGDVSDVWNNRVGVWASASRRKVKILRNDGSSSSYGPWVQVSRLGLPLINEVIIGLQDKDKYNRTTPATDVANFAPYILAPVLVRDAVAVGTYSPTGTGNTPPPDVNLYDGRTDIIVAMNAGAPVGDPATDPTAFPLGATGDVLRLDLNKATGFPNGRSIPGGKTPDAEQADVTDVLATVVLLGLGALTADPAIKDGVSKNDAAYGASIPFLATPWEGRGQGISTRLGAAPALPPTP